MSDVVKQSVWASPSKNAHKFLIREDEIQQELIGVGRPVEAGDVFDPETYEEEFYADSDYSDFDDDYTESEDELTDDEDPHFDAATEAELAYMAKFNVRLNAGRHFSSPRCSKAAKERHSSAAVKKALAKKATEYVAKARHSRDAVIFAGLGTPVKISPLKASPSPTDKPADVTAKSLEGTLCFKQSTDNMSFNRNATILDSWDDSAVYVYKQPPLPSLEPIPVAANQFAVLADSVDEAAPAPGGFFIRAFRFVGGVAARAMAMAKTAFKALKGFFSRGRKFLL